VASRPTCIDLTVPRAAWRNGGRSRRAAVRTRLASAEAAQRRVAWPDGSRTRRRTPRGGAAGTILPGRILSASRVIVHEQSALDTQRRDLRRRQLGEEALLPCSGSSASSVSSRVCSKALRQNMDQASLVFKAARATRCLITPIYLLKLPIGRRLSCGQRLCRMPWPPAPTHLWRNC